MLHLISSSILIYFYHICYHITQVSILCNCWLQSSCPGGEKKEQLGDRVGERRLRGSRENEDQVANYCVMTIRKAKAMRQRNRRTDKWGI